MKLQRHPAAVALDAWLDSEEGQACTQPTTLNAPEMQRQYLKNRLSLAFDAGWVAAEKQAQNQSQKHK